MEKYPTTRRCHAFIPIADGSNREKTSDRRDPGRREGRATAPATFFDDGPDEATSYFNRPAHNRQP
jgi:hypothetical protein